MSISPNQRPLAERQVLHNLNLDSEFYQQHLEALTEDHFSSAVNRAAFRSLREIGAIAAGYNTDVELSRVDQALFEFLSKDSPSRESNPETLARYVEYLVANPPTEDDMRIEDGEMYSKRDRMEFIVQELNERPNQTQTCLRGKLSRFVGEKVPKQTMSRLMISLEEEQRIYAMQKGKEKVYTTKKPFTLNPQPIANWQPDSRTFYPILPVMNEEMGLFLEQSGGGLAPGDLFMFNARRGFGKSYFYLTCAMNAARLGLKVLYLDLEGALQQQQMRLAHILTGDPKVLTRGPEEVNEILKSCPIDWATIDSGVISADMLAESTAQYDVVVLDYLRLSRWAEAATTKDSRDAPGSCIIEALYNKVARAHNKIIITGVQVTAEKSKETREPTFRGSDSWFEAAPLAWTVIGTDSTDELIRCQIKVTKSRDRKLALGRIFSCSIDRLTGKYTNE